MGEHAVEHARASLVAIEALREVIAQIASGLRDAEGQRMRRLAAEQIAPCRAVAQMADDVARRGEADAEHARLRRVVAQFVDRARFRQRALREPHRARIHEFERHRPPLRGLRASHRQHGVIAGRGFIRQAELLQVAAARAGDELLADAPHDRRAVVGGHRRVQPEPAIGPRRTRIPARPHQREAQPQRQRIAEIRRARRLVAGPAGAQIGEQHDAAAVVHFVEDAAVASLGIGRAQDADVAAVLDAAARVARRLVDVDDAAVGGMRRVEFADRDAVEPLVGARRAEGGAADERRARRDLDCGDHPKSSFSARSRPVPLPPRRSSAESTGR